MERYVFIGGIYPDFKMEEIRNKFGNLPQDAADLFEKNIINGLEENLSAPVTVFNTYFLPASFCKFEKVSAYEWQGKYGTNFNLSYTRNRIIGSDSKTLSIKKAVSEWLDENDANDKINVIVYPAYYPFLKAINQLKKKYRLNVCLIVPDLPEFMGLTHKRTLYNKITQNHSSNQIRKYIGAVDSFVFLTEAMEEKLNVYNKPFRIIEGIAPSGYKYPLKNKSDFKRRIVYSGRLQLKYGIDVYLKAISLIEDKTLSFEFYGTGEGAQKIKECSEKDKRIKYMGYRLFDELQSIQQNSLMLINPRQNVHEFTKYSFPSKTMEYMMSARPVIAYKLDGIPDEYTQYIISPEDNSPQKLADLITHYASLPESELELIGLKARDFVLTKKDAVSQTKKIIELFNI